MSARQAALVRLVNGAAVPGRLRPVVHAIVTDHPGNAQPIIPEDFRAALALGLAVLRNIAPRGNRGLVAEERQRQDLAFFGQALEPLDRDEAIDGLEDRPQFGGEIEILLL